MTFTIVEYLFRLPR